VDAIPSRREHPIPPEGRDRRRFQGAASSGTSHATEIFFSLIVRIIALPADVIHESRNLFRMSYSRRIVIGEILPYTGEIQRTGRAEK